MSQGWQLRPAELEDLETVVAIIAAEDRLYRGRSEIDLGQVQAQIAADPSFDAERDIVIADRGGAVIAAAVVNPRSLNVAVHPDHENPDLRRDLLGWGERRQTAQGRRVFRVAVPSVIAPAVACYVAAGYRRERFYASMLRDLEAAPVTELPLPAGYRARPIDPGADVTALHRLDDRAFSGRPDYQPESVEEYDRRHLRLATFAPEWSQLVLAPDGTVAGSLIGRHRSAAGIGYIAILAVDPDHQRRGLASSMLSHAFAAMRAGGHRQAELHVASDNPRALDLYESVGMRQGERFDHFVRDGARPLALAGSGPGR